MAEDRLITLAIHTYEKAVMLKSILENEGIEVVLHNVNLIQPVVSSGVRVRIHEKDLPLALRIVENADIFYNHANTSPKHPNSEILLPVDFTEHSTRACNLAFHLARKHGASIVLLHSYISQIHANGFQLSENRTYDFVDSEERRRLKADAKSKMTSFCNKLKESVKSGILPPVQFTYEIREGVPEEVITTYAHQISPLLIVMGTRGFGKKEKELIGSVSAEVLDSCRVPVLTIPEAIEVNKVSSFKHVIFYAGLEQDDILALDALHRFLDGEQLEVTIVGMPQKKRGSEISLALERLTDYCKTHYPEFTFSSLPFDNAISVIDKLHDSIAIDLIVMPNKKRNMFARLFNPNLAHKLLFNVDIPIMAIPV